MYGCNKRMLWALFAALACQLIAELAILLPIANRMTSKSIRLNARNTPTDNFVGLVLPPYFTGCIPTWASSYNWVYWVPMVTFESLLFILAITKSVHLARTEANTPRILAILLRDSVCWFGGVMVVILANLIIWASARVCLCRSHRCVSAQRN